MRRLNAHAAALLGVGVFLAAAALYARTVAPSVLPGDYAEFQMCAAVLGVPHPTGYPLYIMLGKLFTLLPVGDVAYRVNLSSAVFMAGAVGMTYAVGTRLLGMLRLSAWWWTAALGAVLFAVAPTVWSMALVARSYALNALLVSSVLFCLVSWRQTKSFRWFYASCLFIGLSMAHHGTNYLLLPAYGLYLMITEVEGRGLIHFGDPEGTPLLDFGSQKQTQNPKPKIQNRYLLGVLALLLGLTPMLFLVYRFLFGGPYYWGNPTTWKDFFNLLTGGPFHNQIMGFGWGSQLERADFGLSELAGQYTIAGIAVGLVGLAVLWRGARAEAMLLTLMVAANFFFAMNYALVGYLYFIPTYLIWGTLIAVGLAWMVQAVGLRLQNPVAAVALKGLVAALVLAVAVYRGATHFPSIDQSGQTATRDQTLALLNTAAQGASLYLDWEDVSVVRFYRMVYGMRPDITVYTGDPADWPKWVYCDVTNGVPTYVGKFAGSQPPIIARDFALEGAPLGWKVLKVTNSALYEVPPCGTCATCR